MTDAALACREICRHTGRSGGFSSRLSDMIGNTEATARGAPLTLWLQNRCTCISLNHGQRRRSSFISVQGPLEGGHHEDVKTALAARTPKDDFVGREHTTQARDIRESTRDTSGLTAGEGRSTGCATVLASARVIREVGSGIAPAARLRVCPNESAEQSCDEARSVLSGTGSGGGSEARPIGEDPPEMLFDLAKRPSITSRR